MNNIKVKKAVNLLWIFLASFVLLSLFSQSTSPFYSLYYSDSLEYKLAGSAILDGLVIFKDIFHQKGALFMLVQAIGEYIGRVLGNDRIGTFLIQYINFSACYILIASVCDKFIDRISVYKKKESALLKFIVPLTVMLLWCSLFSLGNLVEEYAMLFELVPVYIILILCFDLTDNNKSSFTFKPIYAYVFGICFAVCVFYKPTTASVVCASIIFSGIYLIRQRNFSCIFKSLLTGLMGILTISLPVIVYYYSKGALNDMIEQSFLFNINYVKQSSDVFASGLVHSLISYGIVFGMLLLAVLLCILSKFNGVSVYAVTISAINSIVYIFSSVEFDFYLQMQVPALLVIMLSAFCINKKFKIKPVYVIALVSCFVVLFAGYKIVSIEKRNIEYRNEQVSEINQSIDAFVENTRELLPNGNNLLALCSDRAMSRQLYYKSRSYPFSKYFCADFFTSFDSTQYLDGFYYDFENSPPEYIVVYNDDMKNGNFNEVYDTVVESLNSDMYEMIYSDNNYSLYSLNQ